MIRQNKTYTTNAKYLLVVSFLLMPRGQEPYFVSTTCPILLFYTISDPALSLLL